MPKRSATGELNHENWDKEEESEERGHFQAADPNTIKERAIKVAKRRALNAEEVKGTGNLFKSFTGFLAPTSSSSTLPGSNSIPQDISSINRAKHLKSLKSLNLAALKWIEEHINKDPHCVLTPIFVDYNKHIADIEKRYPFEEESTNANNNSRATVIESIDSMKKNVPFDFAKSSSDSQTKPFTFSVISAGSQAIDKTSSPFTFSFSANSSNSASAQSILTSTDPLSRPVFSLTASGSSITTNIDNVSLTKTTASSSLFSFGNIPQPGSTNLLPTFSFANNGESKGPSTSGSIAATMNDDENDEYVPPKPEVREIREENSVYSVRCKLFYKSQNDWKEKGLGNLHIKPLDNGKFQLLLRADTNLGNILLNIMVTKDMPFKVMKNNVSFACIPSPPINPKTDDNKTPVSMLLRVKTETVAEELLKEINKHRGL